PGGAGGASGAARADVVVVGAGVAGLCAAWRLAGQGLTVRLLELWSAPGGTAIAGDGPRGPHPWGAHYLTLPGPDAVHVRRILRELGVITGFDAEGHPAYAGDALCLAPEERIWDGGEWIEGLWPTAHATAADRAQRDAWEGIVADFRDRVGADGRPAFTIPIAKSSRDPAIRALADVSFADWLDEQGLTAPVLRWSLEYATRDDYGASLADTSAWAGLHYFCARRPDPSDARDLGTHVLTWPAGNGWLVERLVPRAGVPVETGVIVRAVEVSDAGARVWAERAGTGDVVGIDAGAVVLAVPTRLARHLLPTLPGGDAPLPDQAPWRVAQLHVSALPTAHGVPTAWDSVIYGAASLGYVTSSHQRGTYGGPGVLTWYEPLLGDPAAARRALLPETWEQARDHVLDDLAPSHPDLLDVLERLDVWHWGHGTVRPAPGLHAVGRLDRLLALHPRVHLAHTDLSGVSLFEEASFHGVRAAEAVLALFGKKADSWL
ncbi:MAG: NAD(P)-binding protein, partial [Myxococcota bacterium]